MEQIDELVKKLSPELRREVEDFVRFLLERHPPAHARPPKLGWRGALRDMRGQYTSLELQKKALGWWGD